MSNQPSRPLRLNKFLAERLGVSRREADELIAAGKITINGKTAVIGARLDTKDKVCYNDKIIPFDTDYLYIAFNKPVGYVCSRRAQGSAPTLYDLLPAKYRKLKTVGRLDKDSSGLILLTNDGDFAYRMTHPKFRKTKVYEVELDRPLQPLHQQMISDYGVMLDDGPSKFKVIRMTQGPEAPMWSKGHKDSARATRSVPAGHAGASDPCISYMVVLTEGRNRQIRRTFAALGYTVTKLHRTEFGKYKLNQLAFGKYVIIDA